jgi:hypothetical protein
LPFWFTVTVLPAMVMFAVRATPGFAAAVHCELPLPVPDGVDIVSHGTGEVDVHAHPAWVVTVSVPPLPGTVTETESGETVYVHGAAWSTVNVLPATVKVADRAADPVLAATVNAVVPEPLPEAPLVIVTHDAPLLAVQPQPAVVVTATEPAALPALTDTLDGEIENEQAPACVTVCIDPAIVKVPVRLLVALFAATL